MNETVLIGRSEKFLDSIRRYKPDLSDISSLNGFLKVYRSLKDNLDELQDIRENMESKGYKAPYRSLSRYGSSTPGEVMVEELHDINRHNQYFRMKAAAKKNILDRVKSSISSHKIALGHLEEYAILTCESCDRTYRIQEIPDLTNFECPCEDPDFELEINKSGVFRTQIIPHLPLSGDYMVVMSELTPWGRDSFKKIMKILKQEKKGVVKTVSLVIRVMESGRWIRKRVTLDGADSMNYERELRKKYGSDVRIEFLQFHRKKPTIINDRHTRTALALGYVRHAEEAVKATKKDILNERLNDLSTIEKYDSLVEMAESFEPTGLEEFDDIQKLQKIELDKLLKKENLIDSNGNLNHELEQDIKHRIRIEKNIFTQIPVILILWDIIKYYLSTSYDRRNKYSGPFPYLRPNLDRNQVKVFQDFNKNVVDVLKTNLEENIEYIPQIQNVLIKKFDIEHKIKGLHMKTNPAAFGAAVINTEAKLDIKTCAKLFSVNKKEVENEKKTLQTLGKPATDKAKKFLEMIKK